MDDAFSLFGEPRRPWLEPEPLKRLFLDRSSPIHPDRVHSTSPEEKAKANSTYAALNAAHAVLREPKDRLALLLELERASPLKDIQRIPPGTMDLFVEVGQTCRDVDGFLAEKAATTSPMVKLRLFERGMDWVDRLNELQRKISQRREELFGELKGMNALWEKAPPVGSPDRLAALPLERLEEIYRVLSYVARWTGQIQERIVALSV